MRGWPRLHSHFIAIEAARTMPMNATSRDAEYTRRERPSDRRKGRSPPHSHVHDRHKACIEVRLNRFRAAF